MSLIWSMVTMFDLRTCWLILIVIYLPKITIPAVICLENDESDFDDQDHHVRGKKPTKSNSNNIVYYPLLLYNKGSMEMDEKSSSFLGMVHPIVLIIVIALPLLTMLAFGSLLMPVVPVILYFLNLLFPVGSSGRRKRSTSLDITDPWHPYAIENEFKAVLKLIQPIDITKVNQ